MSNQDPWSKPNNQPEDKPKSDSNKPQSAPPDLDEIFGNLLKKIKGSNSNNTSGSSFTFKNFFLPFLVGLLVLWIATGFYTIQEAERGVELRFGKFYQIVQPGLNWKPTFIDVVIPVNVEQIRESRTKGSMLTKDENLVNVEMTVQYRVSNPEEYLFSVTNADESLTQATDSALRYVIGNMAMDDILTTGRSVVRERTWKALTEIIKPYKMGLKILDVNFQSARPPEEVKDAFDDAIKAQEDEQRYIREAEAYARSKEPIARGQARRLVENANAYKEQTILTAQGEVERYKQLLPAYLDNPQLVRNRLYLQTMEKIMAKTPKVVMENNNLNILPLDKIFQNVTKSTPTTTTDTSEPVAKEKTSVTTKETSNSAVSTMVESTNNNSERKGRFY